MSEDVVKGGNSQSLIDISLHRALEYLDLESLDLESLGPGNLDTVPPGLVDVLASPRRIVSVAFPVAMDDGSVRVFRGHRVL
ncbi:MAG: hypothetical protein ACSLE5_09170, partial [Porticoccaceae bacterium]